LVHQTDDEKSTIILYFYKKSSRIRTNKFSTQASTWEYYTDL